MDSRIEEILKEKVGDEYEEVPLMSRIEVLLDRLGSGSGDSSEYAHSLELTINSQTYVLTATLKNTDGETLGTPQTIDLPLETMVVTGAYDNATKKIILTLKNGNTVEFSVADLVEGLQSEITSTNKLNSDLVDDTNQNNKFVTSAEKTKIANALTTEVYNAGKQVKTGNKTGEIFNNYSVNKANGNFSHAEGGSTRANGSYSHAEGNSTTASGDYSHAEGLVTTASGNYSHAEGSSTTASGDNSHAEGGSAMANGSYSHAEGSGTVVNGNFSHAEGRDTIAASAYQHVQGKFNIEDSNNKYAFIIGNGTSDSARSNAFAVDWNGLIYVGNSSTGINVSQLQPIINSSNKISADFVDDTNTSNKFVTSAEKTKIANALTTEVYNAGKTTPSGTTYTIGGTTYTVGDNAEVFNSYSNNNAIGSYSHAEGTYTMASSDAAHAEGFHTIASGYASHSEGSNTTASNSCSHAEGDNTTASGTYSHAEGSRTTASGNYSHAEGAFTNAIGVFSHAEGSYTIASSNNQHVQGKYNIEDSNSKYAFIIGNGTSNSARSNAFAVDWNGKIYTDNSETGVDVSVHNSALIDLIDSGQKNLVDAQNPSGQQHVTITKGTNGSAVISCENATWATTAYHVYVTPNEDYKLILYVDEADVSNVTLRCFTSAVDDSDTELEVLPRTEQITETGIYTLDINTQYNRIKISPNINNSATAGSGSVTLRMMLCSKAAWDISQKYVPYRPSYDELVARITALENA
jgi:hypothetical protein